MADRLIELLKSAATVGAKGAKGLTDSFWEGLIGKSTDEMAQALVSLSEPDVAVGSALKTSETPATFAGQQALTEQPDTFAAQTGGAGGLNQNIINAFTNNEGVPISSDQIRAMSLDERKKIIKDLTGKTVNNINDLAKMENDYLRQVTELYNK